MNLRGAVDQLINRIMEQEQEAFVERSGLSIQCASESELTSCTKIHPRSLKRRAMDHNTLGPCPAGDLSSMFPFTL